MVLIAGLAFLVAFSVSYVSVPFICRFAYRNKILDVPDGAIKKHQQATPYLGGVAVYVGFLFSVAFFLPFQGYLPFLLIGLTILLLLGLVDDFFRISPSQKFVGQMVAAVSFLGAGFSLKEAFLSSFINLFLSFFWILTVDNAFNLVDVMDGLATSLAIFATASFVVFAYWFCLPDVATLLCAFLGALCAFFLFNRPPAKIYLGDAGALFIGGFLAVVPFLFNWADHGPYGFFVPLVILGIPLLEVASLIVIRTRKGIPFYYGSPDHFCLYLLDKGWGKNGVLLFSFLAASTLFCLGYCIAFDALSLFYAFLLATLGIIVWCFFVFSTKNTVLLKK